MRTLIPALILSLLLHTSAYAQGVATFTYQRGIIHIQRANPPALPSMPWQNEFAPSQVVHPSVGISVDIRPSSSLYRQEGWINMHGLGSLEAMFFVFDTPQVAKLNKLEYYQPLDVLWIDASGTITSIAPHLSLAEIREPLSDTQPSKVIMLMAGGEAESQGIAPGDKISDSEFFQSSPQMLTMPTQSATKQGAAAGAGAKPTKIPSTYKTTDK